MSNTAVSNALMSRLIYNWMICFAHFANIKTVAFSNPALTGENSVRRRRAMRAVRQAIYHIRAY